MTHTVIGMGQIGSAVYQVLSDADNKVETLDIHSEPISQTDILHICFGYSREFVKEVSRYQKLYEPRLTIIYSTVPVGITRGFEKTVHSPVEGRHPRLYYSVKTGNRFIGYNNKKDGQLAEEIWKPITRCELLENSDWTEFLKLASTSKFGINLVWEDYVNKVGQSLGMPHEIAKNWDKAYNQLYKKLHFPQFRKFVLDAPDGKIGGHCILPNAHLLNEQFPHDMLKMIKEYQDDSI